MYVVLENECEFKFIFAKLRTYVESIRAAFK